MTGDPVELGRELVDPDQRLPGEQESEASPLLEDAQHWLDVYGELLAFKETLLRTAQVDEDDAPEPVAAEVSRDRMLIRSELERLRRRHDFWSDRVRGLQQSH